MIADELGARSCNENWLHHTRPITEAFFHARFMLEMAVLRDLAKATRLTVLQAPGRSVL